VGVSRFLSLLKSAALALMEPAVRLSGRSCLVSAHLAAAMGDPAREGRAMAPHMESAIIAVVQKMPLDGLKQQEPWLDPVFKGNSRNPV
jgi:hypothetical protein